jgi:2-keto-3-deoxy-L-rhamnonate aldolase RhmA
MNSKIQIGIWNSLASLESTMTLAEIFDSIYIDLEHGFRSIDDLTATINFYNMKQVDFAVRVRSYNDPLTQTLLDIGVRHFIVPQLRSLEELEIFKRKVLFPPNGSRGLHPRSNLAFNKPVNEDIKVTVVIETLESLDLIPTFAQEKIVSELYLGVFDLSMELEISDGPFSQVLDKYFEQVSEVCKKNDKKFAAMLPAGENLNFAKSRKLDKAIVGIDVTLINQLYLSHIVALQEN